MSNVELIVKAEEWPHGLRCMDCGEQIKPGFLYSKRLLAMDGDTAVVEIICAWCALGKDP